MTTKDILPDVLIPNLKLVICGSAVSAQSSQAGSYYAGQGNKFWQILHETGLTDRLLLTSQYRELLHYQIGLTDVAKKAAGVDSHIQPADYDAAAFAARMEHFRPQIICFNGKKRPPFSVPGNTTDPSRQKKSAMESYHSRPCSTPRSFLSLLPLQPPLKPIGTLNFGTNSPNRSADCHNDSVCQSINPLTSFSEVIFSI